MYIYSVFYSLLWLSLWASLALLFAEVSLLFTSAFYRFSALCPSLTCWCISDLILGSLLWLLLLPMKLYLHMFIFHWYWFLPICSGQISLLSFTCVFSAAHQTSPFKHYTGLKIQNEAHRPQHRHTHSSSNVAGLRLWHHTSLHGFS